MVRDIVIKVDRSTLEILEMIQKNQLRVNFEIVLDSSNQSAAIPSAKNTRMSRSTIFALGKRPVKNTRYDGISADRAISIYDLAMDWMKDAQNASNPRRSVFTKYAAKVLGVNELSGPMSHMFEHDFFVIKKSS